MMNNRYKSIVYKDRGEYLSINAKKGGILEVSEGTNGELIIRNKEFPTILAGKCSDVLSIYTDSTGESAIIPAGWTVSGMKSENTISNGLVIYLIPSEIVEKINWSDTKEVEKLQETYDQFVWVPVNMLIANGSVDGGKTFNQKIGLRKFSDEQFENSKIGEKARESLLSVGKYNGFFISRYNVSKTLGTPKTVKGKKPWIEAGFELAKNVSASETDTVATHLTSSYEYDSILEWLLESNINIFDSSEYGNYFTDNCQSKLLPTGSSKKFSLKNIFDLAGNVSEITTELENGAAVIRGGSYENYGDIFSVSFRDMKNDEEDSDSEETIKNIGFRITLIIK